MELVLLALALFGFFGIWLLIRTGRKQRSAEGDAESILDKTFNGEPIVTVTVNLVSLKYEAYVIGARKRGYTLSHQAERGPGLQTLIFDRVTPDPQ